MALAFLYAVLGTVSTFFGIFLISSRAPGVDGASISLNGWLILFGWTCCALSSGRALQVTRSLWIAGRDTLWPLVWALYAAAITFFLASAIGPELLGSMIPGEHPWAPFVIATMAAGSFFAASALILERFVARTVRIAQTLPTR